MTGFKHQTSRSIYFIPLFTLGVLLASGVSAHGAMWKTLSKIGIPIARKSVFSPTSYYLTAPMRQEYTDEDKDTNQPTYYMAANELKNFKAIFHFGFLWNSNGEKITTQGPSIYVMSEDGSLFINANHWTPPTGSMHHSSFLSGSPVACAGKIEVSQGVVTSLTNESGHYVPQEKHLKQVIDRFRRSGIYLSDDVVEYYSSDEIERMMQMRNSGGWG